MRIKIAHHLIHFFLAQQKLVSKQSRRPPRFEVVHNEVECNALPGDTQTTVAAANNSGRDHCFEYFSCWHLSPFIYPVHSIGRGIRCDNNKMRGAHEYLYTHTSLGDYSQLVRRAGEENSVRFYQSWRDR